MDDKLTSLSAAINKFVGLREEANPHAGYIVYFRGHGEIVKTEQAILPKLLRKENKEKLKNEGESYKDKQLIAPDIFSHQLDIVNLARIQHYGGVTRLLDITRNPLVALFMCCFYNPEADGEVVAMAVHKNDVKRMDDPAITKLTNKYLQSIQKCDGDSESIYLVKTPKDNPRIIAQQGEFLIFDNDSELTAADGKNNGINLLNHKMIIPKEYKKCILGDLQFIGISEMVMFPELERVITQLDK